MAVASLRMNWEVRTTSGKSIKRANSWPMSWDSAFSKPKASQ